MSNDRVIDRTYSINRTSVPFMDERLGWSFPVLDHGFIRIIDYMGDDQAITEAAGLSYGEGTKKTSNTARLINYLMSHAHTSPFEMCELKLHVKLPIFVARQWIRHRTANVNEYSARYSILKEEFYLPPLDQMRKQSTTNKQGREELLDQDDADVIRESMDIHSEESFEFYKELIEKDNLSRELSRMVLPTNTYTEWYWKVDLHNLLHFLNLRADSHAQQEIQDYAQVIEWIVKGWVPLTWNAFKIYRKEAVSFSAHELLLIHTGLVSKAHLMTYKPTWADQLTDREWKAFQKKIGMII